MVLYLGDSVLGYIYRFFLILGGFCGVISYFGVCIFYFNSDENDLRVLSEESDIIRFVNVYVCWGVVGIV